MLEHRTGPLLDRSFARRRDLHQMLHHVPQGRRIDGSFSQPLEVADHTLLHLARRLVREGESQDVAVGINDICLKAKREVVLHQGMRLACACAAMEYREHDGKIGGTGDDDGKPVTTQFEASSEEMVALVFGRASSKMVLFGAMSGGKGKEGVRTARCQGDLCHPTPEH